MRVEVPDMKRRGDTMRPRTPGPNTRNEWGLTSMEERFAQAVAGGKNFADAYRASGSVQPGTKVLSIAGRGSALAKRPAVRARIAMLAKQVEEQFTIRTADILREACRVAFCDPARLIDTNTHKVKLLHELDEDTRRAVASFEIDDLGRIKYRFWPKVDALDKLMKHKGLFVEAPPPPVIINRIELVALEPKQVTTVQQVEIVADAKDEAGDAEHSP